MRLAGLLLILLAGWGSRLVAAEGVEITTVEKRYYLGVIVSETDEFLVIQDAQGIKSQVAKKSVAERTALQDPNDRRRELEAIFDARLAAAQKDDAAGYYELGQWAKMRALKAQATQAFKAVLRIDSGHNGAGAELGWKRVDGKYVDPAGATPAGEPLNLTDLLNGFDPDAPEGTETGGAIDNRAVAAVKNDPVLRGNLYRIVKTPPQGDKQKALRRKAILLIGRSRQYDMIVGLLEILLSDADPPTVTATAQALKYMKYDRMAQVLADLAALNRVGFYRQRALYGLAILEDKTAIDRLLFHAGYQVAGGQGNDQHNPLIEVGVDKLDPMTFLHNRAPATGRENPEDQTPLYPALAAIRTLSGKDYKTDLTNWRLWWTGAQKDFVFKALEVNN